MANRNGKQAVVAFRVDRHLAEELDRLPDKSGFIRGAIERAFHVSCTVCEGRGTVSHETAAFVDVLLRRERARRCPCCGAVAPAAGRAAPRRKRAPARLPVAAEACGHCGVSEHRH
jgi:hypothetical protein